MRTSIFCILFTWFLAGCGDFLEETSQNEIHPSSVSDMEKLLEGEAYYSASEGDIFCQLTDIFTDNYSCNSVNENNLRSKQQNRYKFLWDEKMFDDNGWGSDISIWEVPYARIKGCNVILEYLDQMEGDDIKREHLRGEAYFLRGFYYFYLTNFFGFPYNYGDPSVNLAVPLKLVSGVTDEKFEKNTVAECYAQIEKDLLTGTKLMYSHKEEQSTQVSRVNYLTGYAMLSRMYLYMDRWDEVIQYADSVLMERNTLLQFEGNESRYLYSSSGNVETLWIMQEVSSLTSTLGARDPYTISPDLVELYSQDKEVDAVDLRNAMTESNQYSMNISYLVLGLSYDYNDDDSYKYYVYEYRSINKGGTGSAGSESGYTGGIRVAEVYLNRAEAYIRKYMEEGNEEYAQLGLNDLNFLRQNRFEADGYKDMERGDFADGQALLDFCLRERRRELCGEGNHRWFDLRRTGMPEIKHVYIDDDTERKQGIYITERRFSLCIANSGRCTFEKS